MKLVRPIVEVVKPGDKQEAWFAFKLIKHAALKYSQKESTCRSFFVDIFHK